VPHQQFGNFLSRVFRCLANADLELRHYTARSRTTKIVEDEEDAEPPED
jgi:hypothetical protein